MSPPGAEQSREFDHVFILEPTLYAASEPYVALTRGSKSVTFISDLGTLPPVSTANY
ncbi:ATP-binding domain-containing protein [Glutamicibacter mysorens]|uniref:ATP-binding domain-containing protein n=1 Tax=Glutamicibacter mysorens TaxID=257984 RepID=UPI0020C65620|nr:ATP-binding domain-containing protein [Glutamicibacter mysorens]UTM47192.1 ATP-binding domain-containing protein [Glutamicibacter mysorens]